MSRTRDLTVLAQTIYGEARGESFLGQVAVAWVIKNRAAAQRKAWGLTVEAVCTRPGQFSMWNPGDPNRGKALAVTTEDQAYSRALGIAHLVLSGDLEDPTGGADHYYNPAVCDPAWAETMTETAKIGSHRFMRES